MPLEIFTDESGLPIPTEEDGGLWVGEGWDVGLVGSTRYPERADGLQYVARDGDTLDRIMWKQYRRNDDEAVSGVLAANPGLSDVGPVLPAGWIVILPDLPAVRKKSNVLRLWD